MISNEMGFTASCRVERGQSKPTDSLSRESSASRTTGEDIIRRTKSSSTIEERKSTSRGARSSSYDCDASAKV